LSPAYPALLFISFLCILKCERGCFRHFSRTRASSTLLVSGSAVPAIVPWLLSFVNGMAILGFLFGRINGLLPGRSGITKGVVFGLIGWVLMGLIFFPLIGLGAFAFRAGLGIAPALMSLAMLLTYSVVLATVYIALGRRSKTT